MKLKTKHRFLAFDPDGGHAVSYRNPPTVSDGMWIDHYCYQSEEAHLTGICPPQERHRYFDTEDEDDMMYLEALWRLL